MGSFRRSLFGYRRSEVDAAIAAREERVGALDRELAYLSGIVLERERALEALREELRAANERADRSLRAVEAVSRRVEELHAQARSQATRMRMKALAEAVEVSRRAQELARRAGIEPAELREIAAAAPLPERDSEAAVAAAAESLFEGLVQVDIGPLADFAQLLGFEDAAGQIDATSEISVTRFSEGRATLSLQLDEPVALLRELEERSPLEFRVRRAAEGEVVLDVDADEDGEARAA